MAKATTITPGVILSEKSLIAKALKESERVSSSDGATRKAFGLNNGSFFVKGNNERCFINRDGSVKRFDLDGVLIED